MMEKEVYDNKKNSDVKSIIVDWVSCGNEFKDIQIGDYYNKMDLRS